MTYNTTQPIHRYDTIPKGTIVYSTGGETVQNEEPTKGIRSFINEFKEYVPGLVEQEDLYKYIKAYINRPKDDIIAAATLRETAEDLEALYCVGTLESIGEVDNDNASAMAEGFESLKSTFDNYTVEYSGHGARLKTDSEGNMYRMFILSSEDESDPLWRFYYCIEDGYVVINQEVSAVVA